MKWIRKGVWIADKRGTYAIEDIDNNYIILRDVIMDGRGAIHYGKKRIIRTKDLDNYSLV